ncbi:SDR family NAD(P)-dependent oxidoreductase [Emcibacter nanhaiensis]|uniref:SDR family NAD(P)-dependent oxidoreductase n=1 Tax=Emcibacter nanhaiensis TaxID=1505037 RepID=A0A501PVM4_9PROT|nr:SDR family NAD(P)-dependent oxidoreductase [Emcibacter nanhaiensis]TPD63816.1 SDR family NAD(P)-dependent oxidoreductase [Emcibacter nanhaiensis]
MQTAGHEHQERERVVVVTGASRGVGKGIALALGATGATVYVTGRTASMSREPAPGTIQHTAKLIKEAGGIGIPVVCDHSDDKQVRALFSQIEEYHGYLDILVNNAAHVSSDIGADGPFWKRSLDLIKMMGVGVRSTYISSYYGAPLLLKSQAGLLVNPSGYAGGCYLHGPAYGACKAAIDKMSVDMGIDFQPHNVCAVSLWMGLVGTEQVQKLIDSQPEVWGERAAEVESPRFIGRVIDALQKAPDRMERNAKVWIATELGRELGVKEDDGSDPVSKRDKFGGPRGYNPPVWHG